MAIDMTEDVDTPFQLASKGVTLLAHSRRLLRSKEGLLAILTLGLVALYLWMTLSDIPQKPLYSREEVDTATFSLGMADDFPKGSVSFSDGPSLQVGIRSPHQAWGYYQVGVVSNTAGVSGTLIFILPRGTDVPEAPGLVQKTDGAGVMRLMSISKEPYATVVRVWFNFERAGYPLLLTVPFVWDTSGVSKRIRHGEYEFKIRERISHPLIRASGQYFDPIVIGITTPKAEPLRLEVGMGLASPHYKFIELYPEPARSFVDTVSWQAVSDEVSFNVVAVYSDGRMRFVFDRGNDVVLLLLGGIIGLLLGLWWSARRKAG